MTRKMTTEIHGLEVTVEYLHTPAIRGMRDSFNGIRGAGIQLEPDEPANIKIESVKNRHGEEMIDLLANRILEQLVEKAWEDYMGEQERGEE